MRDVYCIDCKVFMFEVHSNRNIDYMRKRCKTCQKQYLKDYAADWRARKMMVQ